MPVWILSSHSLGRDKDVNAINTTGERFALQCWVGWIEAERDMLGMLDDIQVSINLRSNQC